MPATAVHVGRQLNCITADINFLMVPVGVVASDKVSAEHYGSVH